ncbi:MAG: hypothetical protein ACPG5T_08630, partial [Endozoicomonas sp.]
KQGDRDLFGGRLRSLVVKPFSGKGSRLSPKRFSTIPAWLDYASRLDRLGTAQDLAKRLEAQGWVEAATALRQAIADSLEVLRRSDIDRLSGLPEDNAGIRRSRSLSNISTADFHRQIRRLSLPALPAPIEFNLLKNVCRRAVGSRCLRDPVEQAERYLNAVDERLDQALSEQDVKNIRQEYRVEDSLKQPGSEGLPLDGRLGEYDDLLNEPFPGDVVNDSEKGEGAPERGESQSHARGKKRSARKAEIELLRSMDSFFNKRFVSVSGEGPADSSKLQQKMMVKLLEMVTRPNADIKTVNQLIDEALQVYVDAGYGEEIESIKTAIVENDEFKTIVESMGSTKGVHGVSEALNLSLAIREQAVDRWLYKHGYMDSPSFQGVRQLGRNLARKPWFGKAQMGVSGGMAAVGIGQSTVSLHNLNKFRDSLSPEAYALGITGVGFG